MTAVAPLGPPGSPVERQRIATGPLPPLPVLAILVLVSLLGACGGGNSDVAAHSAAGDLLAGLPTCEPQPSPVIADVEGLHLPPETVVTSVRRSGPLTQVVGFVALSPVEVRRAYEMRNDLELLQSEDEVFESEVVTADGRHRLYVKALAQCAEGSRVVAIVTPTPMPEALPTSAGSTTPSRPGTEGP